MQAVWVLFQTEIFLEFLCIYESDRLEEARYLWGKNPAREEFKNLLSVFCEQLDLHISLGLLCSRANCTKCLQCGEC